MIFLTEEEFELFFFFFHFFLRIRILQSKILQIQRILISILKKTICFNKRNTIAVLML